MFFKTTTDKIMAQFHLAVNKLNAHAEDLENQVVKFETTIAEHTIKSKEAVAAAAKARSIAAKLEDLLK